MHLKPAVPERASRRDHEIGAYERTLVHLTTRIDAALRDPEVGARAFMMLIEEYAGVLLKLKLLLNGGARADATRYGGGPGEA